MPIELLKENLVVRRIGDEYFLLTSGDTMLHNVRGSGVFILEAIEKAKLSNRARSNLERRGRL